MRMSDWSSDVCSSDLDHVEERAAQGSRTLPLVLVEARLESLPHSNSSKLRQCTKGVDEAHLFDGVAFGFPQARRREHECQALRARAGDIDAVEREQEFHAARRSEGHTSELQSL